MSDDIDNFMPYLEERASNAGVIVEIGVGKGTGSTLAFTRGLERSAARPKIHVSVDNLDYMEWKPEVPWWTLVMGDSTRLKTAEDVAGIIPGPADIIFIDTVHTPEQVLMELMVWTHVAGPNTLWLFHDTYMMGVYNPMTDAIKAWACPETGWVYEDVFTEAHGLGSMHK